MKQANQVPDKEGKSIDHGEKNADHEGKKDC